MATHLTLVLDRFEDGFGVFEGFGNIPRALLPARMREGERLQVTLADDSVTFQLQSTTSADQLAELQALRDSLNVPSSRDASSSSSSDDEEIIEL